MNNLEIHKALDAHLEKVAKQLKIPVAWENIDFTPPKIGLFLEANFMPADNYSFAVQGGAVIRRGVYQVTIVQQIGKGTQSAEALASELTEAFAENTKINNSAPFVYVNGEPSIFGGYKDGTGYRIPITIAYAVMS